MAQGSGETPSVLTAIEVWAGTINGGTKNVSRIVWQTYVPVH